MQLLVIGGTKFLGRALVDAALGRGHAVTLFNRAKTNPGLYPGLELVRGDRRTDAGLLAGRRFDAVLDVAGMAPDDVRPMIEAVGKSDRYVFISTVSVYADHSGAQSEDEAVLVPAADMSPGEVYGAAKAAAEQVVTETFAERALVVRPGLIVGPHDPTDRFAYWPRRLARGGRVLAPGGPDHPAQFIDVRDLARWVIQAVEERLSGTFNATGTPTTLGQVLSCCQQVAAARSILVWVSTEALLEAGVNPWMGVPLWIAVPGWEGANAVDISKARAAGLGFRPLADTIADTLAWDLARGGPPPDSEGLSAEREAQLLAALVAAYGEEAAN
jgi:2'-hydroxyisoflavone reductase